MTKLMIRVLATVVTLFTAGLVSKLINTWALLEMNRVAVGQLEDSDAAYTRFTMLQWMMSSGWGLFTTISVLVILFFIWKGQFNVQK